MLSLSPIQVSLLGECTGFEITDTTDYNQLPGFYVGGFYNLFKLSNFELGLRIIQVIYPDGTSQIFCSNSLQGVTVTQYITNITSANNTDYQQTIYTTAQGVITVNIISIPALAFPTGVPSSTQTNAQKGDLVFNLFAGGYYLFQAVVDNPTLDFSDASQWLGFTLNQNLQLVSLTSPYVTSDIPLDYINTVTVTQDCYLTSLECVFNNLDCCFCCSGCCCEDSLRNQYSVRAIKASLLDLELQLIKYQQLNSTSSDWQAQQPVISAYGKGGSKIIPNVSFIPNDSYLNKVCEVF